MKKSTRGASRRTSSATASISSGTAAIRRVSTPSGARRFATHDAFVFGTSPETSSLPIVRIEAVAIYSSIVRVGAKRSRNSRSWVTRSTVPA